VTTIDLRTPPGATGDGGEEHPDDRRPHSSFLPGRVRWDLGPRSFPLTMSVSDAAILLGVSRSAAYRAAKAGQIPTVTFGRRLLVPTCRLLEMLGLPLEEQR
jgi:excisionase family DNA binding protein